MTTVESMGAGSINAEQEFAFVADTPKRSTAFSRAMEAINDLKEVASEHGTLIPAPMLQAILGVSQQRVAQMLTEGKFHVFKFHGKNYVTEESLKHFVQSIKSDDNRVSLPNGKIELLKRSLAMAKDVLASK